MSTSEFILVATSALQTREKAEIWMRNHPSFQHRQSRELMDVSGRIRHGKVRFSRGGLAATSWVQRRWIWVGRCVGEESRSRVRAGRGERVPGRVG